MYTSIVFTHNLNITYSLIFMYVFIYVYILFSFLILLYLTTSVENYSTSFSKIFCWNNYVRTFTIAILLSFSGVPPFMGFFSKFYFFFAVGASSNDFVLWNIIFVNFFMFYFYVQYFRHLYFFNQKKLFTTKREKVSYPLTLLFFIFLFTNLTSFILIDYLNVWVFFIHSFF